jgi:hypothetical protein
MNYHGQLVNERLTWAKDIVGGDGDQQIDPRWVANGEAILLSLREAMHDELDVQLIGSGQIESEVRNWQRKGRELEAVAIGQGLTPINVWLATRR